jgi:hypothetical protein
MTKMLVRHERWFVTLVIDAVLWRKLDNPWQKSTVIDYKVFLVYVAMLVRVQRFTLAGSTPSGSVKCFRISSHNNFFHWVWNHVWIMCFSIPFTTANGHVVPYNGPTLWDILVMIFFWSTWLAIISYFYDLIHDMAGEYLCTPSLCLFWCGGWSLHIADSLFN